MSPRGKTRSRSEESRISDSASRSTSQDARARDAQAGASNRRDQRRGRSWIRTRDLAPDSISMRYNPRAISQYRDRARILMSQYQNDAEQLAQYAADTERDLQKVHDALRDIPTFPKPPKVKQRINASKGKKNKKNKKSN